MAFPSESKQFPLLALRDVVVYPHMVIPLFVGREKSIKALEEAMETDKQIVLVAQVNASDDDPAPSDLYQVGTIATILQLLKLPDGTVKVLVEGANRAFTKNVILDNGYLKAEVRETPLSSVDEREGEVLARSLLSQFEQYVKLSKKVASEILTSVSNIEEPGRLSDTIAAHLALKIQDKQRILEIFDIRERIDHLMALMEGEIDLLQVEKRIRGRVKKQMEKSQREYYLNEQMKAIQKELGDLEEGGNELEEFEKKIESSGMTKEAKEKTKAELNKLKMMSPMSAEATVVRSYLDWMVNLPWKKKSKVRHDLKKAKEILDQDHYGLDEVKERILEYLAVQARVNKIRGPVLCLVGPPGVGKTSLGQSIAKATNRKFVRMALGGVRDEAEIRGHRRTYIGSMPGKLVQKISKVGVKNPLFLLDEIDKMGVDMRGDPASALLEVLDPEQNNTFNDHYLEVDYDLSDVLFICTSNSMNIPAPLLDRMEVIRIPGYTEDEKLNIAQKYLVPKQRKMNGLKEEELDMSDDSIRHLIRYYTRESGVRGLEREIAKVCRKHVKENVLSATLEPITISPEQLEEYSGVRKFNYGKKEDEDRIGQVTGLAWTSVGGELLTIEAASVPGKGRQIRTGSLGDVMQESIQAALTVVRSRSHLLGISPEFHDKNDIHIHVPEGATPKDGPSAGIGMCTALVSVLTNIPVRSNVAMTGEITLRGQVLPIGGLKEKLLAAHRGGITTIIIPKENERDLKEIPDNIKEDLDIHCVKWIDEVLELALVNMPEALPEPVELATREDTEEDDNDRLSTH
ncbi:MAG: endopeptidase La [Pseudomonadales bacterium]|jgi:ATP-dependent Lon protease|uniref:endopeptidase La n=1 Tax=unclassified Ketobacter TaxID=2639109 RepID=UPI000C54CDAC|nr:MULTISPECIES: endopeptidase La [unclassified Ketobacter]MAQ26744.1 endopeptidase La [Pseudomonadales bacterium]MEC8811046.1 endopeptidase La [Pseudomonadota bacterium]TNC88794.1 MAG: endopeptidase La [Alcanivorax sp.]HAG95474.1 endopeptidase La [Gammaproteobacteria bacterium]MBI28164.1 endopeptidase La [Pseudomonadales bacterium]|tara:strand:- start:14888 stop:17290 length:2403 start_codon:yes stop_codon:yes gene_type:complete